MRIYYTVNVVLPKIYTLKLNPHMVAFGGDKSWGWSFVDGRLVPPEPLTPPPHEDKKQAFYHRHQSACNLTLDFPAPEPWKINVI